MTNYEEQPGLVSILIPCYNAASWLAETLESALAQTWPRTEIIVVDDGSTDDSLAIARSFEERGVTVIAQENQGACAARNRGAALASGAYLMFLDADDLISAETLSALVKALRDEEDAVAACPWSMLRRVNKTWREEEVAMPLSPPRGDPIYGWLSGWYIPPCAVLWPREAYEQVDGWDESLHANQDGDIMLRAFLKGAQLVQTRAGKAYYRNYDATRVSVSSRQSEVAIRSRACILKRVARKLNKKGEIEAYAEALGKKFYGLARQAALVSDDLYAECLHLAKQYAGTQIGNGTLAHRVLSSVLGLQRKEKLAAKLGEWGIGSKERCKSTRLRKLNR